MLELVTDEQTDRHFLKTTSLENGYLHRKLKIEICTFALLSLDYCIMRESEKQELLAYTILTKQ